MASTLKGHVSRHSALDTFQTLTLGKASMQACLEASEITGSHAGKVSECTVANQSEGHLQFAHHMR